MSAALDKLSKVLDLERAQGYEDRAVIGGLAAFLEHWRRQARDEELPSAVVRGVAEPLDRYASLDAAEREARVDAALRVADRAADHAADHASNAASKAASTAASNRALLGAADLGASAPSSAPRAARAADRDSARASASEATAEGRGSARRAALEPRSVEDDPRLEAPLDSLKGVGAKTADALGRLGLRSLRDLLLLPPARYEDFSQRAAIASLRPGQQVTVAGTVVSCSGGRTGRKHLLSVVLEDASGRIDLRFFNQPWLERRLRPGTAISASGRVAAWRGRPVLRAPSWEPLSDAGGQTGRLLPVYPLTQGLAQATIRRHAARVAETHAPLLGDPLPAELRRRAGLLSRPEAVRALHLPADRSEVRAARLRLGADELLAIQLWARRRRREREARPAWDLSTGRSDLHALVAALPFALTGAQARCLGEIEVDLARGAPMQRLLQGDVGSGKTAVAAGAVAMAVGGGGQAALMAPTAILAEQHFRSLAEMLAPLGWRVFDPTLETETETETEAEAEAREAAREAAHADGGPRLARLVGAMSARDKERVAAAARRGEVDLLVGTHALIQDRVGFARLALSVVDEQHRFGVLQRAEVGLRSEDEREPHLLYMTATPIPRTLALVLNADLDQSLLDELPPGRKPIKTRLLRGAERERAYAFVRRRVEAGEQAYIIYPLVEESESVEARAAVEEHERLGREALSGLRLGLLHGRMRPAEKDAVMAAFRAGEHDVLVSTTVVEVGVDVPNATVMLIDGAERFGLAQLHQLRGRVGRGARESVCLLISDAPGKATTERLRAMVRTGEDDGQLGTAGMRLAELDLEQRGPGDYFGLEQSGHDPARYRFARLAPGAALAAATSLAEALMEDDPELARPAHRGLRRAVAACGRAVERA